LPLDGHDDQVEAGLGVEPPAEQPQLRRAGLELEGAEAATRFRWLCGVISTSTAKSVQALRWIRLLRIKAADRHRDWIYRGLKEKAQFPVNMLISITPPDGRSFRCSR
jgi:hypothetical protein